MPKSAREIIARLPRTFGPSFNDQLTRWELLFPAEQRRLQAQLEWLNRQKPEDFKRLLAPILEIESKMELPHWDPGIKSLSVTDAGILARSPNYPQWRSEVEKVFARMDEGVGAAGALKPVPRLLACILPAGLPVSKDPLWPDIAKPGSWVNLKQPFGATVEPLMRAIAARKRPEGLEDVESTWLFECESRFSGLPKNPSVTAISWTGLAAARREFLTRLNAIRRDLKSVDDTNQELGRMDMGRLVDPSIRNQPRVREFVRSLLLSGNGSLVFPNSFVQWGASEALHRAEPQVMLACFGMRQKLKPFSSSVLFEDQTRGNPVGDENDPAGSLVDDLMLSQYVYLASQRVAAYQTRTLSLMAASDLNRVLVFGLKRGPTEAMTSEQLVAFAVGWLESEG